MHLTQQRFAAIFAAILAALALAAAPAMAGEDDDDGDDEATAPAQTVTSSSSGSSGSSETLSNAPVGGVATGAGGTAMPGPDATLLGLASGALVLLATGGGMIAVARRDS